MKRMTKFLLLNSFWHDNRCVDASVNKRRFVSPMKKGYLIVEAIFGIFIMSVVFIAVIPALIVSIRACKQSQEVLTANQAARQIVENIRKIPSESRLPGEYPQVTNVPQLTMLRQARAVARISAWKRDTCQVTVSIVWLPGSQGTPRRVTVTTLLSPRGVTP